ncbi:MAG: AEC family transporter [Methanobrevibacter sp.]|nr:AEC family transporter [Methanobrevibacter sp.]
MNAIEITILSIVLMIVLGVFLRRIDFLGLKDVESLNNIVIYILMPCMVFSALYSADLSLLSTLGILPFIILASSFITGAISYLILKKFNIPEKRLWSIVVAVMIANTAFMGYPINLGIFGQEGLLRAIFCDIATLIIFLILSFVLSLKFGGSTKSAIKKIALFPSLWAVILGIMLNFLNIPIGPVLENTVNYLGDGSIPLIMLSLGVSIDLSGLTRSRNMIIFTSAMKLILYPIIAFIFASIVGLVDLQFKISIIEAAMPSGLLSLVLAISYKLDFELTSDCILIDTVVSLLSLPILIMLL